MSCLFSLGSQQTSMRPPPQELSQALQEPRPSPSTALPQLCPPPTLHPHPHPVCSAGQVPRLPGHILPQLFLCTPSPWEVSASWDFSYLCRLMAASLPLAWNFLLNSRTIPAIFRCISPQGCPREATVHKQHCPTNLLPPPGLPTWYHKPPKPTG